MQCVQDTGYIAIKFIRVSVSVFCCRLCPCTLRTVIRYKVICSVSFPFWTDFLLHPPVVPCLIRYIHFLSYVLGFIRILVFSCVLQAKDATTNLTIRVLDPQSLQWSLLEPSGEAPCSRGGHTVCDSPDYVHSSFLYIFFFLNKGFSFHDCLGA